MNTLADEGLVLCAAPLAGTKQGRLSALLIISAHDEAEVHLAEDPWTRSEHLRITSIEPRNVFVGAQRLSTAHGATGTTA